MRRLYLVGGTRLASTSGKADETVQDKDGVQKQFQIVLRELEQAYMVGEGMSERHELVSSLVLWTGCDSCHFRSGTIIPRSALGNLRTSK